LDSLKRPLSEQIDQFGSTDGIGPKIMKPSNFLVEFKRLRRIDSFRRQHIENLGAHSLADGYNSQAIYVRENESALRNARKGIAITRFASRDNDAKPKPIVVPADPFKRDSVCVDEEDAHGDVFAG